MKSKIVLIATLLSINFFIGCDKDSTIELTEKSAATAEEIIVSAEIDAAVDDVSNIAEDQFTMQNTSIAKTSEPVKSILPACASITSTSTADTWTRTINFGTEGCQMPNGNVLKGKIMISASKNTATPVRTISYTLEGFYHDGKLIEGIKSIKYEVKTSDLLVAIHPVTTHAIDMKVTLPNGKIITRVGSRVREMVEGMATAANWENNVFNVWGSQTTTFADGSKFSTKITVPLQIKMSCKMPFPVLGIVETTKGESKSILDYGNGSCDKLATLIINGVTKEISLRK
jgi:hypothetical protein